MSDTSRVLTFKNAENAARSALGDLSREWEKMRPFIGGAWRTDKHQVWTPWTPYTALNVIQAISVPWSEFIWIELQNENHDKLRYDIEVVNFMSKLNPRLIKGFLPQNKPRLFGKFTAHGDENKMSIRVPHR